MYIFIVVRLTDGKRTAVISEHATFDEAQSHADAWNEEYEAMPDAEFVVMQETKY